MKRFTQKLKSYDFFDTFLHTINYFWATILINALGIISLPVYTYFLSTYDYGTAELFNTICKIGLLLFTFNCFGSVFRYSMDKKEDNAAFAGSSLILGLLSTVVVGSLVLLFLTPISTFFNMPPILFQLAIPVILANVVLTIFYQIFIAKKKSKTVSLIETLVAYARFFMALGLLFFFSSTYIGKIYGDVIGVVLMSFFALYKIYPYIKIEFKWGHWEYMKTYSIPLSIGALSFLLLNYFDQLMINSIVGREETGLYSFAYKIGMLLYGLGIALDKAAKVDYFTWMNEGQYGKIESQVKSMAKLLTLGGVFLVLFAIDMGNILASNKDFTASLHLVPIIVVGFWFAGIYLVYVRPLQYSKKTFHISFLMIISVTVNIVLNSVFIPKYGYEIAAYTTLASTLVMTLGCLLFNKLFTNEYPIPALKSYGISLVYLGLVVCFFYWVNDQFPTQFWLNFFLRCLVFGFVGLLFFGRKILAWLGFE